MPSLFELMKDYKPDVRSPKQKLIDRASEATGREKRVIAVRIAHLSEMDCDFLLKRCEQARNFGAYFNWSLKAK